MGRIIPTISRGGKGMEKGYVQIYTGNGKGKTTAALGLGLRAVGSGKKVIMIQFMKGSFTGELISAKLLGGQFEIFRIGEQKKFSWEMTEEEKEELRKQIETELFKVFQILKLQACDILILDEILGTLAGGMLSMEQVLSIIDLKPETMELVLTGRHAPKELITRADLVTEMNPIKHYYDKGVLSREGIEY